MPSPPRLSLFPTVFYGENGIISGDKILISWLPCYSDKGLSKKASPLTASYLIDSCF
jgi:hypothetical protein